MRNADEMTPLELRQLALEKEKSEFQNPPYVPKEGILKDDIYLMGDIEASIAKWSHEGYFRSKKAMTGEALCDFWKYLDKLEPRPICPKGSVFRSWCNISTIPGSMSRKEFWNLQSGENHVKEIFCNLPPEWAANFLTDIREAY